MLERLAIWLSQGPQAILIAALAVLSCAALLMGFI
jgi:hypothetical protein